MNCPIGLDCAEMGLQINYCANRFVCLDALEDNESEHPFDLCGNNPNIKLSLYWDDGAKNGFNFWKVTADADLELGYAQPVPVNLPVTIEPGVMTVIKNHEVLAEDGALIGHYAVAEWNRFKKPIEIYRSEHSGVVHSNNLKCFAACLINQMIYSA